MVRGSELKLLPGQTNSCLAQGRGARGGGLKGWVDGWWWWWLGVRPLSSTHSPRHPTPPCHFTSDLVRSPRPSFMLTFFFFFFYFLSRFVTRAPRGRGRGGREGGVPSRADTQLFGFLKKKKKKVVEFCWHILFLRDFSQGSLITRKTKGSIFCLSQSWMAKIIFCSTWT